MKPKVHAQVQPRDVVRRDAQVQQEIQNFMVALDSYPDRAAKEPRLSFRQHLGSIFTTHADRRVKRTRGR